MKSFILITLIALFGSSLAYTLSRADPRPKLPGKPVHFDASKYDHIAAEVRPVGVKQNQIVVDMVAPHHPEHVEKPQHIEVELHQQQPQHVEVEIKQQQPQHIEFEVHQQKPHHIELEVNQPHHGLQFEVQQESKPQHVEFEIKHNKPQHFVELDVVNNNNHHQQQQLEIIHQKPVPHFEVEVVGDHHQKLQLVHPQDF